MLLCGWRERGKHGRGAVYIYGLFPASTYTPQGGMGKKKQKQKPHSLHERAVSSGGWLLQLCRRYQTQPHRTDSTHDDPAALQGEIRGFGGLPHCSSPPTSRGRSGRYRIAPRRIVSYRIGMDQQYRNVKTRSPPKAVIYCPGLGLGVRLLTQLYCFSALLVGVVVVVVVVVVVGAVKLHGSS